MSVSARFPANRKVGVNENRNHKEARYPQRGTDGCEPARAEEQDDEAVDGRYKGDRGAAQGCQTLSRYERCPDLPSPVLAATMVAEDVGDIASNMLTKCDYR